MDMPHLILFAVHLCPFSSPKCSCVDCHSVAKWCLTLCDPMDCSTSGFLVFHYLLEFAQTHIHWVGDIPPSHPLSSLSPLALNLSWHQGLFQWVGSLHQVIKVLELQHLYHWIRSLLSSSWYVMVIEEVLETGYMKGSRVQSVLEKPSDYRKWSFLPCKRGKSVIALSNPPMLKFLNTVKQFSTNGSLLNLLNRFIQFGKCIMLNGVTKHMESKLPGIRPWIYHFLDFSVFEFCTYKYR